MGVVSVPRRCLAFWAALAVSACASGAELKDERAELGDFFLSHAIVVAEDATALPGSRPAEAEEWEEVIVSEMRRRLGRYDGDKLYHIGVNVQAYMIAPPGIPLVLSPRSALGVTVDLWDDAAGGKLNDRPHRIIVGEAISGETIVGSGNTQTREEQMQNLAENVVLSIENWLAANPDWFPPRPEPPEPLTDEEDPVQTSELAQAE
ncbi:hypothetical protein LY56_01914 [Roseinatronobacter thiooxidans]|uniref:DUF4136 domain-containing protein n=1 Tax=Roseinatronobacter thiooxidans TaxID=121821 RepID=A0A2W7Q7V2_9RHOB|nr:hypothetical protein [Roseinatronobacter thiooxidans]PZX44664.1 hypothetical protein LY56_01914 [Roseinatronobacter thiooxidans]